jgi:glutamate N-acetyltransferase / amino-acid N-acetyltransferase
VSVTFARGFRAGSAACGLKQNGNLDLTLVVNRGPLDSAAAVFTTNRAQANPIIWSKQAIQDGRISAILLNSGGANCYTGSEGFQTTHHSAERVAGLNDINAADVLVCSTGLIGQQLDRHRVLAGIAEATAALSPEGGENAALAIMTTDSVPKLATRESGSGWRLGGMAKGAGMLAPGLATMLVVITTDAQVSSRELDRMLQNAVRVSFNRLDSDGCMSTNDQVTLLASGAAGIPADPAEFEAALTDLCLELALKLLDDAEGASHNIHINVVGAETEADAVEVGRSIARNNLFKAAIYGNDPNWGRILAAIGTTSAHFDPYGIDVSINGVRISTAGGPDQPRELVDLSPRRVDILIDLHAGSYAATIYTNDLTLEYVTENSAYSS